MRLHAWSMEGALAVTGAGWRELVQLTTPIDTATAAAIPTNLRKRFSRLSRASLMRRPVNSGKPLTA